MMNSNNTINVQVHEKGAALLLHNQVIGLGKYVILLSDIFVEDTHKLTR
jgi:hypothetical protein